MKYFYFWLFWLFVRSLHSGYDMYQEYKEAGYNIDWFEKTGQKIEFKGGFKGMLTSILPGVLGLLISPAFLVIETIKFIPAALFLYLIS